MATPPQSRACGSGEAWLHPHSQGLVVVGKHGYTPTVKATPPQSRACGSGEAWLHPHSQGLVVVGKHGYTPTVKATPPQSRACGSGEAWLHPHSQGLAALVAMLCLIHIVLAPFSGESLGTGLADRLGKIADVPVAQDDGLLKITHYALGQFPPTTLPHYPLPKVLNLRIFGLYCCTNSTKSWNEMPSFPANIWYPLFRASLVKGASAEGREQWWASPLPSVKEQLLKLLLLNIFEGTVHYSKKLNASTHTHTHTHTWLNNHILMRS